MAAYQATEKVANRLEAATRAKALNLQADRFRGFKNPLPRTKVRGFHQRARLKPCPDTKQSISATRKAVSRDKIEFSRRPFSQCLPCPVPNFSAACKAQSLSVRLRPN
jgi:hypothetical protein